MPKIKVNGQEIEASPGKTLIEVLKDHGTDVPHFCWHPGLKPHGNCRMCLVKVSNSRKLEVACTYPCAEGMEVSTESPEIDAARKSVMEYLLINHPLDCPICDKAGECTLQDHTFDYRHGTSRFEEPKNIRHTKDLGPNIRIWGNRCIACTRCVRFCDDISGTSELSLVNRGDHAVIDVHPEFPIDNPMSLNVVDICPVGALIDKNFLYQARVWFAKKVETVCAGCSRGCNVDLTVHKNEIKRMQPRHNGEVNDYWMCDAGRLGTGYVHSEARLKLAKGSAASAANSLADLVATHGQGSVAIVASTYGTLEELFLLKKLATALGAPVAFYTKTEGQRWVAKNGFSIETDKTPNTKGAELIFGTIASPETLVAGIEAGKIKGLLSWNGIPDLTLPEALVAAAAKLEFLAVADLLNNALVGKAHVVLPTAAWAEKDGSFMNKDGRMQRIRGGMIAPGQARADGSLLQDMLVAIGVLTSPVSAEGVFREAFPGLDYAKVGSGGLIQGAAGGSTAQPEGVA